MFSKLKITFDCLLTLHLKICEFLIIVHILLEASSYGKMPLLFRYLYKEYDVLKYSMSLVRLALFIIPYDETEWWENMIWALEAPWMHLASVLDFDVNIKIITRENYFAPEFYEKMNPTWLRAAETQTNVWWRSRVVEKFFLNY